MGGNRRNHNQMQLFCDAIDACGFVDLRYLGSRFTWSKYYTTSQSIWERLDRALCKTDWLNHFAGTKVIHLTCTTSDLPFMDCSMWYRSPTNFKAFPI